MTIRVFKYKLKFEDTQHILMPQNSVLLTAQMQHDSLCLWAQTNSENPTVKRAILIRGTGHEMGEAAWAHYIASVQIMGGDLVFHIFDGGDVTEGVQA